MAPRREAKPISNSTVTAQILTQLKIERRLLEDTATKIRLDIGALRALAARSSDESQPYQVHFALPRMPQMGKVARLTHK